METLAPSSIENSVVGRPFFLSGSVPFPEAELSDRGNVALRDELEAVWPQAEEDFVTFYQSTHGNPIQEALAQRVDYESVTLEEIGSLVDVSSPNALRKVRAALQVGELIYKADVGLWNFTKIETVQLMVGLIGKKYRNIYVRNLCNSQDLNPNS